MGGDAMGFFNALLGFDILSSVLRELLGAVSRLSSTSTKLSSFSSLMGLGKPSSITTTVPRLEQGQCTHPAAQPEAIHHPQQ